MPANVQIGLIEGMGPVFVNAEGYTLYSSRHDDKANISKCNADRYSRVLGRGQAVNILPDPENRPTCEEAWPPFRPTQEQAKAGDSVGHWKVMTRHDDSLQWSYQGKPVYLSSHDQRPGQMIGVGRFYYGRTPILGRSPLYAPLNLPVGMDGQLTHSGLTLTDARGYVLYTTSEECDRECESLWKPFVAPLTVVMDSNSDTWSVVARQDGTPQWAWKGKPLYTFSGDLAPGQASGEEVAGWNPVLLYPAVEPPADITVQMTGDGEVFADSEGMTLYAFYCFDEAPDHLSCDTRGAPQEYRLSVCGTPQQCMEMWRPLEASEGAQPVGETWTIVAVDPTGQQLFAPDDNTVDPLMVWAYHGRPLFTYAHDRVPGDIVGDKVSHLVDWGFWMLKK